MYRYLLVLLVFAGNVVARQGGQDGPEYDWVVLIDAAVAQYDMALPTAVYPPVGSASGTFAGATILFQEAPVSGPDGYEMVTKLSANPVTICANVNFLGLFDPDNLSGLVATLVHEAMHVKHYNDWTLFCENLSGSAETTCKATRDCHFNVNKIVADPGSPTGIKVLMNPCAEAFADYEAAKVVCEIACTSTDQTMRQDYMSQAKSLNMKADQKSSDCSLVVGDGSVNNPAAGKCMAPMFFDPATGESKTLGDYAGQKCCCDIVEMEVISCAELDDCDDNGLSDSQEIDEDPSLDMNNDGELDECEDP